MTTTLCCVYCVTCAEHVLVDVPVPLDRRVLVHLGTGELLPDLAGQGRVLHEIAEHIDLIGEASS